MMRNRIARLLALGVPAFFFGSFVLIYIDPAAILPALGMFIVSLVLVPLSVVVAVTGRYQPLPWDLEQSQPTDSREYRAHTAVRELDCDGCGATIDQGDNFYVLWDYDDVLGRWADADAPRLCAHCASIREHADALGFDGVTEAYASGRVDDATRDEMVDYLLAQDQL